MRAFFGGEHRLTYYSGVKGTSGARERERGEKKEGKKTNKMNNERGTHLDYFFFEILKKK